MLIKENERHFLHVNVSCSLSEHVIHSIQYARSELEIILQATLCTCIWHEQIGICEFLYICKSIIIHNFPPFQSLTDSKILM